MRIENSMIMLRRARIMRLSERVTKAKLQTRLQLALIINISLLTHRGNIKHAPTARMSLPRLAAQSL